jgi:hypothetical protein
MNDATAPKPAGPSAFIHHCSNSGCTAWGSFGHGYGTKEERWYCREHDPHGGRGSHGEGHHRA